MQSEILVIDLSNLLVKYTYNGTASYALFQFSRHFPVQRQRNFLNLWTDYRYAIIESDGRLLNVMVINTSNVLVRSSKMLGIARF